jgi:CRP-like cAMP-binding protein
MLPMAQTPNASAAAILKKVAIFSGMDEPEFAFLTAHVLQRKFSAGEMIFGEAEPCNGLYVIKSGHVRIFKSSAGGREQVLSIDGAGSSIAELPVFDGGNFRLRRKRLTTVPCCSSARKIFRRSACSIPRSL